MIVGHLDQHDAQTVGILEPHLEQTPRLLTRPAQDRYAGCQQAVMLVLYIANLQPQGCGFVGTSDSSPGDLKQAAAKEEHQARVLWRPEFAVHGKPEGVAVEPPAALGVRRVQEDPAAQHVHGDHLPLP